mmetsp:Transcript_49841/g.93427  ORF Transcript_49841/g.93427 Transcript_49841/m.93427 type:complete len:103 (+) Transcript_49841:79-387(+)
MIRAGMRKLIAALLVMSVPLADAAGSLRQSKYTPGVATAMAGVKETACTDEEYERYKSTICGLMEACECGSSAVCKLDWCVEYIASWQEPFGACFMKGCPPP